MIPPLGPSGYKFVKIGLVLYSGGPASASTQLRHWEDAFGNPSADSRPPTAIFAKNRLKMLFPWIYCL
jgi:hypothetical protein